MSILFDENPLVINPSLAKVIGLNEAIILQQMNYWLKKSTHYADGKRWIYNSVAKWQKQFPFFSDSTIKRAIKSLVDKNILFVGEYNRDRRDRTKWYSINELELESIMSNALGQNDQCIRSDCSNGVGQNDQVQGVNLTQPLPETTTEITTEITTKENTKEKSTPKSQPKFDPLLELTKRGADKQKAEDFLTNRKTKRSCALTLSIIETTEREAEKAGLTFAEVIAICADRGWAGFRAHYNLGDNVKSTRSSHSLADVDYSKNVDQIPDWMEELEEQEKQGVDHATR